MPNTLARLSVDLSQNSVFVLAPAAAAAAATVQAVLAATEDAVGW